MADGPEISGKNIYQGLEKQKPSEVAKAVMALTHEQMQALGREIADMQKRKMAINPDVQSALDGTLRSKILEYRKERDAQKRNMLQELESLRTSLGLAKVQNGTQQSDREREAIQGNVNLEDLARLRLESDVTKRILQGVMILHPQECRQAGIDLNKKIESNAVNRVFDILHSRDVRVRDLQDIASEKDALRKGMPWGIGAGEAKALYFLALITRKSGPTVQKILERQGVKKDIQDMTITDLLREGRGTTEFVSEFATNLRQETAGKSPWNFSPEDIHRVLNKAHSVDVRSLFTRSETLKGSASALGIAPGREEMFAAFCIAAADKGVSRASDPDLLRIYRESSGADQREAEQFSRAIGRMHAYVKSQVLPYLQLYTRDEGYIGKRKFSDVLSEYLGNGEAEIGDIVGFYVVAQTAEKHSHGTPLPDNLSKTSGEGYLSMHIKILQLLYKLDPSYGNAYKGYLARFAEQQATSKLRDMNIPPEAIEALSKVKDLIDDAFFGMLSELAEMAQEKVQAITDVSAHYLGMDPLTTKYFIYYLLARGLDETFRLSKLAVWLGKKGSGLERNLAKARAHRGFSTPDVLAMRFPRGPRKVLRAVVQGLLHISAGGGAVDLLEVHREIKELNIRREWDNIERKLGLPDGKLVLQHFTALEQIEDMATKPGTTVEQMRAELRRAEFSDEQISRILSDPEIVSEAVVAKARGGSRSTGPVLDEGDAGRRARPPESTLAPSTRANFAQVQAEAFRLGIKINHDSGKAKTQAELEAEIQAKRPRGKK